jgi:hypothetical protein
MPIHSPALRCARWIVHINSYASAALRTDILPLIRLQILASDIELEVGPENISTLNIAAIKYWIWCIQAA